MVMSLKRKKRVLAIDDEPAMTEWLKILLEHAGYEVRTALIGTRGEELFKTWRPDAVVTDMILPDVDGIELVRKFKQIDGEAEVIVITRISSAGCRRARDDVVCVAHRQPKVQTASAGHVR